MAKSRHAASRSSLLVSWPVIVALAVLWGFSLFNGGGMLSATVMLFLLLSVLSRLWSFLSTLRLRGRLSGSSAHVFAGRELKVRISVANDKLLPLSWLDLYIPLPHDRSITCPETRRTDQWEAVALAHSDRCAQEVGYARLGRMLWYEKSDFSITLKAQHRGLAHTDDWALVTGDGFGLSQNRLTVEGGGRIVVYPRLVDVETAPFLEDMLSADSGRGGLMDDLSVIRSTRSYMTGDNLKHINWRLVARGQGLTVNTYEDIVPRCIHFIFDGESFSGPQAHADEMEEALSVLASLIVSLNDKGMRSFVSLPLSRSAPPVCISPEDGIDEELSALSMYAVLPEKLNEAGTAVVGQKSVYDMDRIASSMARVRQFCILCYDASSVDLRLGDLVGEDRLTVVASIESRCQADCRHIPISRIHKGVGHE